MTSTVRPPAVAGMFYPNDTHELRRMVHQFLKEIPRSEEHTSELQSR